MMKVDIFSSKKKKAKSVQDVYKTIKKQNTKQNPGLLNWRNGVFFVPRYKHHFGMTILLGVRSERTQIVVYFILCH